MTVTMDAANYLRDLISFPSVSRDSNADVSAHVADALRALDFETELIEYFDANHVQKVSVVGKLGSGRGGLAYFAHTDVVPADDWYEDEFGPFRANEKDGRIYGRGSCDMKGSIACMLAAVKQLGGRTLERPLYVTCTADEEVGFLGARSVVKESTLYREMVLGGSRGIIGEPTCLQVVYAHKGVVGFRAVSRGRSAHSSTNEGLNANLAMIPFLAEMKRIHDETEADPRWHNTEFHPPSVSWNIGINDHTRAINITPPQSICTVYYRPMPGTDAEALLARAKAAADENGLEFTVGANCGPVYTDPGSPFVKEMLELSGNAEAHTVAYGTDGSEFGELERLVIFGPGDIAQAHTNDEWISLDQLHRGTDLFGKLIRQYCL